MAPRKPTTKSSTAPGATSMATKAGVVKSQHRKPRRPAAVPVDVEPKTDEQLKIARQNQVNSPLLRLPPEVRNRIFEYALTGHNVALLCKPVSGSTHARMPKHSLALLVVSRQLYAETAMIPFTQNTFTALDPGKLNYLLRKFPRGTSASMSMVGNIQISYYMTVIHPFYIYNDWRRQRWNLSRFSGLKYITLLLQIDNCGGIPLTSHEVQTKVKEFEDDQVKFVKGKYKNVAVTFQEV